MRPTVVVTNWVHREVLDYLSPYACVIANESRDPWSRKRLIETCSGATALLAFMTDHVDDAFLEACPSLRMIGCALKGYDNFDVEACRRRGVTVSIVPDLLTDPTAELAVGLVIALGRNILSGDAFMRSGQFRGWRPRFYGTGLANSLVGIIGMGAVGQAIARRLRPFGCAVWYSDPRALSLEDERAMMVRRATTNDIATACDFVMVVAPLVDGAKHMIDADFLVRMKRGASLINVGRGSVVDEPAVAAALESGHLGGFAADVYEMEDWARPDRPLDVDPRLIADCDKTVLTPHLGSAVNDVRQRIALCAARNIVQFLSGERPENEVAADTVGSERAFA